MIIDIEHVRPYDIKLVSAHQRQQQSPGIEEKHMTKAVIARQQPADIDKARGVDSIPPEIDFR
jgi:hypothetical protein